MFRRLSIFLVLIGLFVFAGISQAQDASTNSHYYCSPSMPPRLIAGENGRVTPGLPNILRTQPGRGGYSQIIGEIPAGGVFTVLAGYAPQCANGMLWWYVSYNGIAGWTPESDGYSTYWVEPIGLAFPCPQVPRLQPGGQGIVTPGLPNILRSQPGRGGYSQILGEIPAGGVFTVMYGYAAQCADGKLWWYVSYNNLVGWTPEGDGYGIYWTEPYTGGIPSCPSSLPTRLSVGGYGRVTPGLPNSLREAPGFSGRRLGYIPANGVFSIIGGPQCANNIVWWQVNYNGRIGWTAEGRWGTYWLEPHW